MHPRRAAVIIMQFFLPTLQDASTELFDLFFFYYIFKRIKKLKKNIFYSVVPLLPFAHICAFYFSILETIPSLTTKKPPTIFP